MNELNLTKEAHTTFFLSDNLLSSEKRMSPEPPKPWLSRFASWLFLASTLNPSNQASPTTPPPPDEPVEPQDPQYSPQSNLSFLSTQDHFDQPREPVEMESSQQVELVTGTAANPDTQDLESIEDSSFSQEDIKAQDDLVVTYSIPPYPPFSISESLRSPYPEEDNTISAPSSPLYHYQIQRSPPLAIKFPATGDSSSSSFSSKEISPIRNPSSPRPTTTKHSPNSSHKKTENLQPADHEASATPKSRRKPESWEHILHVKEIIDKQELGKHILVLAIPMVIALVISYNSLASTLEKRVIAIALSFAFASIWNGILLRETYPKGSTLILIVGIALMALAFYALVGCFLPLKLKWIPGLCWLATVFPLAIFLVAFFRRMKVKDPERAECGVKDAERGVGVPS